MTLDDTELFKIAVSIATITYSVVFGIVAKKVWDIPKTLQERLDVFERTLSSRINQIQEEQETAARRLDVHDRISSKIIKKDFDSKSVSETGLYPVFRHE